MASVYLNQKVVLVCVYAIFPGADRSESVCLSYDFNVIPKVVFFSQFKSPQCQMWPLDKTHESVHQLRVNSRNVTMNMLAEIGI